ncbi:GNAT family N-acetyltransferase [Ligilactobacillus ruminis]|uniref:GNAT family N-acetyltransferase n=1 Tax=Ligilactobacillus ruminis TaxID=1623 RepID=UPI003F979582
MELVVNPKINKNELIELYKSVGWTADVNNIDNLRKGMKKSYVIAAYEDKKLIGLVRALSDYSTVVYVQDLLVASDYQGRRVGKSLMHHLLNYFGSVGQIIVTANNDERIGKFFRYLNFREESKNTYEIDRRD